MWCAVHVKDGSEARTEAFVSGVLSGRLNARCFHLTRIRRKKFGGQWRTVQEDLFPGYVFIDTDRPETVHWELKRTMEQGLPFHNEMFVSTLRVQESDFMECIMDEKGGIGLSKIEIEPDGGIRYLSGPLLNVRHLVRKIDLHKRLAEVEADFLGEKQVLYLGIEIVGQASAWEAN